jgi:hypothetical protein
MSQNVFIGQQPDPILTQNYDYDQRLAMLRQLETQLQQQRAALTAPPQPTPSAPTLWQQIEAATADLSDREFNAIRADAEFIESEQRVAELVAQKQLEIVRPMVEQSSQGQEALAQHLATIRRLKKRAASQADEDMELFREYTRSYSDLTFNEFLKTRRKKKS